MSERASFHKATHPLTREITNVASIPHRSPFRYPGGKTWLVPHIRRWLMSRSEKPKAFCEPLCGGAIVGLSMLFEGLTDQLVLVELDDDVAAVWQAILDGHGEELIERIGAFQISRESVTETMKCQDGTLLDHAFATIVRNRVQRGGILAPGASLMKQGENGRGLASRWYPQTLQARIRNISSKKGQIVFVHGDGIQCMREYAKNLDMVFFIDPPYTVAGRRLYKHSEIDHEELFRVADKLRGDFLMTYDDAPHIRGLAAKFGCDTHIVAMKNTHHRVKRELLIGRNLEWARRAQQFAQDPLFSAARVGPTAGKTNSCSSPADFPSPSEPWWYDIPAGRQLR